MENEPSYYITKDLKVVNDPIWEFIEIKHTYFYVFSPNSLSNK